MKKIRERKRREKKKKEGRKEKDETLYRVGMCVWILGVPRMPARLWFQEMLLESHPGTGEVQIHVSGIMLRYKSRNYVDRDKRVEKRENARLSFREFNVELCHFVRDF